MQLEQAFELPVAPAAAWAAFQDIGLLVDCLPGASLTGPAVDGDWPLRFEVKLGPIAAAFAGSGRLAVDDAARSGRFEGQAADKRTQSRAKGVAAFQIVPTDTGTRVQVTVDYALTGSLAQFSRGGIVRELASALTGQFAGNLAARLTEAGAGAAVAPNSPAAPTADATAVAVTPGADAAAAPPSQPGPVAPGLAPAAAHPATPRAAAAPLSAVGLLVLVLKARWQALLQRLRGKPAP